MRWSAFPVDANPRPVVLIGTAIIDPSSGFANTDMKVAYTTGRFHLTASLPSNPGTRDGYSLISAAAAVRQMFAMRLCCVTTTVTLDITHVRLVEHRFVTDRGEQNLPAWQVHIAGVRDDAYVLAVTPRQRYPLNRANGLGGGGQAAQAADGRTLTIYFVAHHTSTGPCDSGFTSTLAVAQTRAAVAIVVTTHLTRSRDAGAVDCGLLTPPLGSYGPLYPGAPNTRTITLDQPLGNRVVVNALAKPSEVTTV